MDTIELPNIDNLKVLNKGGYEGRILIYKPDIVIKYFEPFIRPFLDIEMKKYKLEEFKKAKISDNILAGPKMLVNVNNEFSGFTMKKYDAITIGNIKDFKQILNLYQKLFKDLNYLHSKNIIIGDVKHDNIIVENNNPIFVDIDSMGINGLPQDHISNQPRGIAKKIPGACKKYELNDYKSIDKILLFTCMIDSFTNKNIRLSNKILESSLSDETKEIFNDFLLNNDIDYGLNIVDILEREKTLWFMKTL